MNKEMRAIKTKEEARQYATEWQLNTSEDLSYEELAQAQSDFVKLAERFELEDEFAENGII